MLLLGLTGSIATGKSTLSTLLSSPPYNLPIIDADILARRVVEPGSAGYQAIVSHFSSTTPDLLLTTYTSQFPDTGNGYWLNRPALGKRVFGDSDERKQDRAVLNGIVHPAVRKAMVWDILRYYIRGYRAVVLDIPLLFESGLDELCGVVMVIACSPQTQMKRLRARDAHLSQEDAENRVRSQGNVADKARRCEARGEARGVVIWNDGGREELQAEVQKVFESTLMKGSPEWWSWMLLLFPPLAVGSAMYNWMWNKRVNEEWRSSELRAKAKL